MSAPPALYPLSVGEILDAAIYVYRKSFVTLVGIGAVVAAPLFLFLSVMAFLDIPGNPFSGGQLSPLQPPPAASESPLVYLTVTLATALFGAIAGAFQIGAIAFVVAERRMGRHVAIGRAYRQALGRWSALIGSTVLVQLFNVTCFVLILGPLILPVIEWMRSPVNQRLLSGATFSCFGLLLFLPVLAIFVYVTVRWSFIAPAIVLEDIGAVAGMRRSWRLVKGSFWRALVILVVVGVSVNMLMIIVTSAIQFTATALIANWPILMSIATSAAGLAIAAVFQPLLYAVNTLVYYDLRTRHEGYDLQIGLDQLKQRMPPATQGPA